MLPTRAITFKAEEPNTTTRMWHQWFNIRVRQYMILEIFFVISLIMILYRFQTISNQNDRVLEMIKSMQSKFGKMERKLESLISQTQNQDISPFDSSESLEQSIADELKSMEFPKQYSTDQVEPIIIPQINLSISETAESALKVPIPKEQFRINAADFLRGATVDIAHSSSSSLNPIIGYDQSNLVLLDRPRSTSHKAWCTNTKNPVLTINLAKYIKPISVSYQHSKWNGTIPNGAPKTYDVVACLDFNCEQRKPLVSKCQYSQYQSNEKEQICNISSHLDVPSIGKVQFRFRENYGDTKMTCVHLVRVYGETKTPVKIEEESLESEEICTNLRWYYHNSNSKYTLERENCTVLYENNCCSECPECCQECLTPFYKTCKNGVHNAIAGIIGLMILFIFIFGFYSAQRVCIGWCIGEHNRNQFDI
ncbi:hypothetical protein B9Z55_015054 [Caenorhabditis nigoni]|uniref:SUN domain-containing protein n=1 Tax=Caenorhabditis nigoni TaxID=1611254 RepID=A0A2G5U8N5_9PELO|nr:hypothetical protein B9Z55_015054 [Caenorhabditis nigoni]